MTDQPNDAATEPVTRSDLLKLEAKLERRYGVRILGLAIAGLLGLGALGFVLDQRDSDRFDSSGELLMAIQASQANLEALTARSGRNIERTCRFAESTARLLRAFADQSGPTDPAITDALDGLDASVADGCDALIAPPTTTPDG